MVLITDQNLILENMHKIKLELPEAVDKKLEELAKKHHTTKESIIRNMINVAAQEGKIFKK